LEEIALTGGTQERVAIASTLPNLRAVYFGFGNIESLAGLENLTRVERFVALWVKRVSDLGPLTGLHALRAVEFDTLAGVSSLPSFRHNEHLHTVICKTMNGLKDLDGLKGSTVRALAVINSRVPPEALERISHGLPQLKHLVLHLGRARDTEAAARHFDPTVMKEWKNAFEEYYRDYIRTDRVRYSPAGTG
jgi:hypothetical protein